MDVVNSLTDKKQAAALLVLPKHDMISKGQSQNQARNITGAASSSPPPQQLVLMQLPASLSMDEFQKAGNCRFLASTASSSSLMATQSCCLVVESQGCSFDLVKVETSNSLILIPPSVDTSTSTNGGEPQHKKPKIDTNDADKNHNRATQLSSVPCRLLQAGGSGASFLELRSKPLCLKSLRRLLQPHLFDPYHSNSSSDSGGVGSLASWQGRTVESLAHELLLSQTQIVHGLQQIQALALVKEEEDCNSNNNNSSQPCYGILSEEALLEGQCALLSALAECNEFDQYATAGIPYDSLVQQAIKRMNETYPYVDQVLRHCVQTTLLWTTSETAPGNFAKLNADAMVKLDMKKVATCVAKQLFFKQKEPWEEEALLSRWQSELPGVGEDYQVSLELLRGVAIRTSSSSSSKQQTKWKYFATHQLPLEPEERFQALFREQEVWTWNELEPYLEPLAEETHQTTAELLHRYAKVVHKETQTGEPFQLYSKL